jgi:hypothetical protein
MKRWSGWASRPLVAAVLMMLAAPGALVRPEPSRIVPPVIDDCPQRRLPARRAASLRDRRPNFALCVIVILGQLMTWIACEKFKLAIGAGRGAPRIWKVRQQLTKPALG